MCISAHRMNTTHGSTYSVPGPLRSTAPGSSGVASSSARGSSSTGSERHTAAVQGCKKASAKVQEMCKVQNRF